MTETWKRPDCLEGYTIVNDSTSCGKFYLTLNECDNKLCEVRMLIGKSGNCVRGLFEVIAILLSTMLQSNIPREKIAKTLEKAMETNCGQRLKQDKYKSCIDFVVKSMVEDMLSRGEINAEEN